MKSAEKTTVVCTACGFPIESSSVGVGCPSCLLLLGMEGDTEETGNQELPEAFGAYAIARDEDGRACELGRGAMGVTYRAIDTSLNREVALKIIRAGVGLSNAEGRERFAREARAAAALRHPNVATVYQFGIREETGQCFCAMELIEGETLEDRVRGSGPLDARSVIEIARQIASALAEAEKRRLVHRDLKPANIMIVAPDNESRTATGITVKIIDFGVAKALTETPDARALTHHGFIGTPAFASPEQFTNETVDVRSDIYSLGATIWYLLTGRMPFNDRSSSPVAEETRFSPPSIQPLKDAHVPGPLISLVMAMLAATPAARPSVPELRRRLQALGRSRFRGVKLAVASALLGVAAVSTYLYLPAASPIRSRAPLEKSVAVLPFENLSTEEGSANFADSVQDELLTKLARIAGLKVVSRTSTMQYRRGGEPRNLREIGRQLGVAFVVEGTVRTIGPQVRISVQLIDARTDLHQWGENYDRPLKDLFAIQTEITQTIAERLHSAISPPERALIQGRPTSDLEAFNLYSRAKTIFQRALDNLEGCPPLTEAVPLLDRAVARDPNFALAYCELANVHSALYYQGCDHTPARLSLGQTALDAASNLNPAAGEVHLARARNLYWGYRAYEPALAELALARRVLPNDTSVLLTTSAILQQQGKWEESIRTMEQAITLDPLNVSLLQFLADAYASLLRYADQIKMLDRALALKPEEIALRINRANVEVDWHADTRLLHATIANFLAEHPADVGSVASAWLDLSYMERDPIATDQALAALRLRNIGESDAVRFYREGTAARYHNEGEKAERLLRLAHQEQEKQVAANPDSASATSALGFIDALLGNKEAAIREGLRSVELCPVTRDHVLHGDMIFSLGMIYAWTGELSLACDQVEQACHEPPYCSHALFRLMPVWDPLRGYPRFEQFLDNLAGSVGEH